jgi:hypothetical protein
VAHAAGVLHRDVKPSNVLIGANDQAVLTDFGIATFADDPKLTQTGMVMGSPGFTAPERIRGEDASPASDLWSLGATIYAAVEGHGPFERRGGAMTTMSAIINENAPEASTAGALGPVIAALLRREPEDRPDASAAERMITNVLPQLEDQGSDAPSGYAPTALSASSRPAPAPAPRPGETALDFGSADQALAKDPSAERTGPPADIQAQAAQTTPSSAQPGQGDQGAPARHEPSAGSRGPGYAAGSPAGYAPGGSADPPAGYAPSGSAGSPAGYAPGGPAGYAPGGPAGYAPGGSAGSAARPEGGQGDFSSWYDPAPRSGASPGSGSAWSGSSAPQSPAPGSGYPAPAGYGPTGWPGQSSQQAPSTPPWSGSEYAPPRQRRSGLGWKAAVAALAIIGAGAGAATVVLLHHSNSGSPQNGSSSSAPPSTSSTGGTGSTLPPALLVTAINQPLTGPPPAGYKNLTKAATGKESAGFTINYPSDWTVVQKGVYQTWLYAPQSGVNMLVDLTPHTYPSDMVQEAQYIETQSIPHFPGYQRIDLKALTIRGTPGSFWKFTWMNNGVRQEALDFLFIKNQQSYALYATAPASRWNQMQPVFDEEVRSFAPK